MKRLSIAVATATVLTIAPTVGATADAASGVTADYPFYGPQRHSVVEDDPYTVLKPWIGTYSHVVRANRSFVLQLEGFEAHERVVVTIDSKTFTTRVRRNGEGRVRLRAPRNPDRYDIAAVGQRSDAEASTRIRVVRRR